MLVFEVVIVLLLGGAFLAGIARNIGAPYPALIALAGAGLALIPGLPTLRLDPELALALFVAPVLVDAAFDSSQRDLVTNWRIVTGLAFGAVLLTIGAVALIAHWLVPDLPWAAAVALGAIVAPPDAASATTVLKQLRPPHQLLVILEGESLFNDASALLIYRLAVGATVTGVLAGWSILPMMLLTMLGSVVLGVVLSRISLLVNRNIQDISLLVIFQFCTCFAVWILAERLHLSGIITLVAFGMAASRLAPKILPARLRIQAWAIWEVAVFVLNVLAFVLVGLQLKGILEKASGTVSYEFALVALVVTVTVILARLIWVMGAAAVGSYCRHDTSINFRSAAIVGWCGMRGTVTLAAALALPENFPQRDLVLTTAFGVTIGTLVLQGLSLRPLMIWLGLRDDGSVEREVLLAREAALRSAVTALHQAKDVTFKGTGGIVRQTFELQHARAEQELRDGHSIVDGEAAVIGVALNAQRDALIDLRTQRTIGDLAFQRIQEEQDWMELGWGQLIPPDAPN